MDWGNGMCNLALFLSVGYTLLSILLDPETWQEPDISKPALGNSGSDDSGFYWAMMMNQRGDE